VRYQCLDPRLRATIEFEGEVNLSEAPVDVPELRIQSHMGLFQKKVAKVSEQMEGGLALNIEQTLDVFGGIYLTGL
jgi:hypothetical protein